MFKIAIFMFLVSFGFVVGFGVERYRIRKMTNQMLQQLEEQKRLLRTRNIIDL